MPELWERHLLVSIPTGTHSRADRKTEHRGQEAERTELKPLQLFLPPAPDYKCPERFKAVVRVSQVFGNSRAMTSQIPVCELCLGKGVGTCHALRMTQEAIGSLIATGGDIFFNGTATGRLPMPQ